MWRERQLSRAVERIVERLAKQDVMRSGLTLHGLRRAGGGDAGIVVSVEHAADKMAKIDRRPSRRLRTSMNLEQ